MDDQQQQQNIVNLVYEDITENDSTNFLDDEFKNSMEIVIAEYIGTIPKNYFIEHRRLAGYTFYPPLNSKQLRVLAIDNITSNEVKCRISEKVYKQMELIFEDKIINWNSVVQTTVKRFVSNAVEEAVELIKEKLFENIDNETTTSNIIIQRFVLVNNLLKVV